MKNNKGFIGIGMLIVVIVAALIVGGGAVYLVTKSPTPASQNTQENNIPQENQNSGTNTPVLNDVTNTPAQNNQVSNPANNTSTTVTTNSVQSDGSTCYSNLKYFVISKTHNNATGSDILVKYKASENQDISCIYSVGNNDFEVVKGDNDFYFESLKGDSLILDSGTSASSRGVTVYDLSTRKKVFNDIYYEQLNITDNAIKYWGSIGPRQACPGGVMASYILFDLSNFTKKDLGEKKCIYQE